MSCIKYMLLLCTIIPFRAGSLSAQTGIPTTTTVTENFDAMAAGTTTPANWEIQRSAAPTWAGGTTALTAQASSGSPTAGGSYNWGTSATERALGVMTSGSYASPNSVMGWFRNTNAGILTQLTVSYDLERYRINTAAASVQFYYSTDGSTWTSITAGDIAAATIGSGASAYGYTPQATFSVTGFNVTGLSIASGADIYLRWNLNTSGSNSQGIGIDNVSVTATFSGGCVTAEPTSQSASIVFPNTTCSSIGLSWTSGNGANRIVVASLSPVAGAPSDLASYTANAAFGSGSAIAAGEYVVYNGSGSNITVTALSASTTYYFKIFEYNGSAPCQNYLTSGSPATRNETTIACSATYCPHLTGVLINACNGSCQEGDNEILFFNSGSYSIPVSAAGIVVKYGTTDPPTINYTSSITSNAAFVSNLNTTAGCGTLFYDAVTAGTIPANTTFIIVRATACYGYDFSSFCSAGPVYVVFSNAAAWTTGGNFANSGTAGSLRYFRADFSGVSGACITDYNYEPDRLTTGGDGDQIAFPNSGGAASDYFNSGSCNASLVVLPIELLNFNAEADAPAIQLSWSTASETNNDYFTLERSTDAVNFEAVTTVKGAGNSTSVIRYGYSDKAAAEGLNYYRLKQTDYNGESTYSGIVQASTGRAFTQSIYPNPAADHLNIKLEAAEGDKAAFEISDLRGLVLLRTEGQNAADGIFSIEINSLPAGTYILKSRINNRLKQTLFIKQ